MGAALGCAMANDFNISENDLKEWRTKKKETKGAVVPKVQYEKVRMPWDARQMMKEKLAAHGRCELCFWMLQLSLLSMMIILLSADNMWMDMATYGPHGCLLGADMKRILMKRRRSRLLWRQLTQKTGQSKEPRQKR